MKLLFDQNLPRALVHRLNDLFPSSAHVTDAGLERASDSVVWTWARENNEMLVTKDRDFERSDEFPGPPPKCILITLGNASTDDVEELIRHAVADVEAFEYDTRRLHRSPRHGSRLGDGGPGPHILRIRLRVTSIHGLSAGLLPCDG